MKKVLVLILIIVSSVSLTQAQDCKIPDDEKKFIADAIHQKSESELDGFYTPCYQIFLDTMSSEDCEKFMKYSLDSYEFRNDIVRKYNVKKDYDEILRHNIKIKQSRNESRDITNLKLKYLEEMGLLPEEQ